VFQYGYCVKLICMSAAVVDTVLGVLPRNGQYFARQRRLWLDHVLREKPDRYGEVPRLVDTIPYWNTLPYPRGSRQWLEGSARHELLDTLGSYRCQQAMIAVCFNMALHKGSAGEVREPDGWVGIHAPVPYRKRQP
jgi:hypothetical protein